MHDVRFFSTGFSLLSIIKGDARLDLAPVVDRTEDHEGVTCHLHRSLLHPVSLPGRAGVRLNGAWLRSYKDRAPQVLREWIAESDVIVIDAGLALAYMPLLAAARNAGGGSGARWLYHASDSLATIGTAANLRWMLTDHMSGFSGIRVPASQLAAEFPDDRVAVLPQGIDAEGLTDDTAPNPFGPGRHAVAVGSMLFDPGAIVRIATTYADMTVHVIGAGKAAAGLSAPNISVHPEMPFAATQAYIRHADLAIAPYDLNRVEPYLGQSSLKLAQYAFHGVPAVCPDSVVAGQPGRFGYRDTGVSLDEAVAAALAMGRFAGIRGHRWEDTADAFLAMAKGTGSGNASG